jgi:hypothetical protein
MKFTIKIIFLVLGTFALGLFLGKFTGSATATVRENFAANDSTFCYKCNSKKPCDCGATHSQTQEQGQGQGQATVAPSCPPLPDMSKYVLKATVPPCPPLPDLSKYMLKTECPPYPDMSKYVLKSSVPKCPPCIASCSKPCKSGECPPCPRPRCPVVKCPEPRPCQPCPTISPERCPEPQVSCKSSFADAGSVRPMLASTANFGF